MAYNVKIGSFSTGTGTGALAVTGLGFQPKAIYFWSSGRVDLTDAVGADNAFKCVGATDGTDQWAFANFQEHNSGTSDTDYAMRADCCILKLTTGTGIDGRASITSLDANGFTLNIDDNFSISQVFFFIAFGGDEITGAKVGLTTLNSSNASQAITGLGFQPACLLAAWNASSTLPTVASIATLSVGAASSPTNRFAVFDRSENGNNNATLNLALRNNQLLVSAQAGTQLMDIDSFDVDGFTVDYSVTVNFRFGWLALAGGQYHVGDLVAANDTNDIVETDPGFKPSAVMFFSNGLTNYTSSGVVQQTERWSIGAATGPNEQLAVGVKDVHNAGTSNVGTSIDYNAVYNAIADGNTLQGVMDLVSMDDNGFTCVMSTPTSQAAIIPYIAFGSATPPEQDLEADFYPEVDDVYDHQVNPGPVNLSPVLFADFEVFYIPIVGRGPVDLLPSLYTESDIFYGGVITTQYTLTAALYDESDTFYAHIVSPGAVNLLPPFYTEVDTFYIQAVAAFYTITPSRYDEIDVFYSGTVETEGMLLPNLFTEDDSFYTQVVTSVYGLMPSRYDEADTFYNGTVFTTYSLLPSYYAEVDIFYIPTIVSGTQLIPDLFVEGDTFYGGVINAFAFINPELFTEDDSFYTHTLLSIYGLTPGIFEELDNFYVHEVTSAWNISPDAFAEGDVFYGPEVVQVYFVLPDTFVEDDSFYSHAVDTLYGLVQEERFDETDLFYTAGISTGTLLPGQGNILGGETIRIRLLGFEVKRVRELS